MGSRLLTVVAILLGGAAVVLIVLGMQVQTESDVIIEEKEPEPEPADVAEPEPPAAEPAPEPVTVVVAARHLSAGTHLLPGDLRARTVDESPNGALSDPDDVVGRRLRADVAEGNTLTAALLYPVDAIADRLQPEHRAFAVPVDELSGVGGMLRPGDHVDVVGYLRGDAESVARVLVEYARVLSYGPTVSDNGDPDREQDSGARTAVLAVDREAVPVLLMAQQNGALRLSLRGEPEEETAVGKLTELPLFAAPSDYSRRPRPAAVQPNNNEPPPVQIHRGRSREEVRP